jgi:hypothetical protein
MLRFLAIPTALVVCVTLGTGCQVARALLTTSDARPAARNQKDIAACEKMCEVAGDAEKKDHAVAACKKDCRR